MGWKLVLSLIICGAGSFPWQPMNWTKLLKDAEQTDMGTGHLTNSNISADYDGFLIWEIWKYSINFVNLN